LRAIVAARWSTGFAVALACAVAAASAAPGAAAPAARYLTFIANSRSLHPSVELAQASGASPRRLGPGVAAALAPSGGEVAVVEMVGPQANSSSELVLYRTRGGKARKLYHYDGFLSLLGWSADSRLLLAAATAGSSTGPLLVINAANGHTSTLARGTIEGASFAPDRSDRVVYAAASSLRSSAAVNLFVAQPSGARRRQLTDDGRSSFPVWGSRSIIFTRSTSRGTQKAPINQLWSVAPDGADARQLTHMSVGPLVAGLVPVAVSADGRHLLADFEGTDTSAAWTVDVHGGSASARPLNGIRDGNIPDAISRDGQRVLLTNGFEGSPSAVQAIPWGGGAPVVLAAHGANASWNS
jgi:hypothetical protein